MALSLYDNVMIEPKVEEEVPSLFYVKAAGTVTQIAEIGYMPVFSADGRYLAYIGTEDGQTGQVMIYEPRTRETYPVPGSEGASTCFWLSENQLGVTFELDDALRLVSINLETGEIDVLVEKPAGQRPAREKAFASPRDWLRFHRISGEKRCLSPFLLRVVNRTARSL